MALTTLSELRSRVQDFMFATATTYTPAKADRALRVAGQQLVQMAPNVTKVSSTIDIVAGAFSVSLASLANFERDRFLYAMREPKDAGAWSGASVAYLKGEMVTLAGISYIATANHTSTLTNGPGASSFWEKLNWTGGAPMVRLSDVEIAGKLNDNTSLTGPPTDLGVRDSTAGFVWPVSDGSYTIRVFYTQPLLLLSTSGTVLSWVPGTSTAGVTLNIPDEYGYMLAHGASTLLEYESPSRAIASAGWQSFLADAAAVRARTTEGATMLTLRMGAIE